MPELTYSAGRKLNAPYVHPNNIVKVSCNVLTVSPRPAGGVAFGHPPGFFEDSGKTAARTPGFRPPDYRSFAQVLYTF